VALPRDAGAVADTVRWCDAHDVPMIPRGGGTGLAGGAVPLDGGVVISLERLSAPVTLEPELWRAHVPAGTVTGDFQRRARESGLLYAFLAGNPRFRIEVGLSLLHYARPQALAALMPKYKSAPNTESVVVLPVGGLTVVASPVARDVGHCAENGAGIQSAT